MESDNKNNCFLWEVEKWDELCGDIFLLFPVFHGKQFFKWRRKKQIPQKINNDGWHLLIKPSIK